MQAHAYDAMHDMQENHWWWRGMRRLYRYALRRYHPVQHTPLRLVDVGCGFGANLCVLNPLGEVVGVDVSLEALQAIQPRPTLGLVQAEADALPFRAGSFNVIALLAVIEHVDQDNRVLTESYRVARSDAVQILLTSAFMFLWSHHDVANNHRRRYRAGQLDRQQHAAGWQVVVTSYVNAAIFPAVATVRMIQRRAEPNDVSEYDMGPNLGPFNRVLEGALAVEAWLITHWRLPMPFGVDVFSVARRVDHQEKGEQ